MALFHNSPPGSGQVGVNHANGVTEGGQVVGIACGEYTIQNSTPPCYAADLCVFNTISLPFQKIVHLGTETHLVPVFSNESTCSLLQEDSIRIRQY